VDDVQDLDALMAATEAAKAVTDKPSMIKVKTVIGFGSKKQGTHGVHGSPLGVEDLKHVKSLFGFNPGKQATSCS
jgi:transketolase